MSTKTGSPMSDYLPGTNDADTLQGLAGDDQLFGLAGNDLLEGGDGNDTLFGDDGDDLLMGDAGDDYLSDNSGNNWLQGGAGNDYLTVSDAFSGTNTLDGGEGNDSLRGSLSNDTLLGGDGDDDLYDAGGKDHLMGGAGNDTLSIYGSSGLALLEGGEGNDWLYGYNGNDTLNGGTGSDQLEGGSGNDVYYVDNLNDRIRDSSGNNDTVHVSINGYKVSSDMETVIYAPGVEPLPYFINTLVAGEYWGDVGQVHSLNYSFVTQSTRGVNGFQAYTQEQQAALRTALSRYSDVADLRFTEVVDNAEVQLRFFRDDLSSAGAQDAAGYAYYPNTESSSEIHINTDYTDLSPGDYGFQVLLHESGHALGLKHPHEDAPILDAAEDTQTNTIMTYNTDWESAQDLGTFDLASIHYLYGVNQAARSGNDTYVLEDRYIWDGAGYDTLSAANQSLSVSLNLQSGNWNYAGTRNNSLLADGQAYIGFGTIIENAVGGRGHDVLRGNTYANQLDGGAGRDTLRGDGDADTLSGGSAKDRLYGDTGKDFLKGGSSKDYLSGGSGNDTLQGGSGNDVLNGGKGNDLLIGGSGHDKLTGGSGADRFAFNKLNELGLGELRDLITDFKSGVDVIDLSGLDADINSASNEAFTFIGNDAFHAAGQLRFADGVLYGNHDADLTADFEIELIGVTRLSAGDVIA